MRVLLVGNYAQDGQHSMLGFLGALRRGLSPLGVEVETIWPTPRLGKLGTPHVGAGKWLAYVDKFVLFPPALRRAARRADLVHICDQGNGMYVPHVRHRPNLITLHDLILTRALYDEIEELPLSRSGRAFQRLILKGIDQAGHAACVSSATLADALRLTKLGPERTSLVLNGVYKPFAAAPRPEAERTAVALGLPPGARFLLHVGGNTPNKNRLGLVRIYGAVRRRAPDFPFPLVMVGRPAPENVRQAIAEERLGEHVIEITEATDDHVRALYSIAEALIFPSLHEGFGLPVVEAQMCGCPVFASNRAPLPEVGGPGAIYFDPADVDGAAATILADLGRSRDLVPAGFENVKRFTTERMLGEYVALYANLLGRGAPTLARELEPATR